MESIGVNRSSGKDFACGGQVSRERHNERPLVVLRRGAKWRSGI
jgi:hypothetical protein